MPFYLAFRFSCLTSYCPLHGGVYRCVASISQLYFDLLMRLVLQPRHELHVQPQLRLFISLVSLNVLEYHFASPISFDLLSGSLLELQAEHFILRPSASYWV